MKNLECRLLTDFQCSILIIANSLVADMSTAIDEALRLFSCLLLPECSLV